MKKEKFSQKERESVPEVMAARNFFIREMNFLGFDKLRGLSTKELFSVYRDYINQDASRENFKALVKNYKGTEYSGKDYRSYLLGKLPKELQATHINKSVEELEEVHNNRKELGVKMLLGFHVSDINIPEKETIGENHVVGGVVKYSLNPLCLYGHPGSTRYLYLVEGSENDKNDENALDVDDWRQHYIGSKGLRILGKFHLTPELEEALGLEFREVMWR